MDNVSADFTINENQPLQAEYTLGESEHFDCSFELFATGTAWGLITGNLEDQTDLWNVLSSKADTETVEQNLSAIEDEISDLSDTVDNNYTTLVNRLENDELAISNNSGEITSLSNTIQSYGDIVTYNASSFATSAQGALADTALQSGDNISELVNNVGYITSASLPTLEDLTTQAQLDAINSGATTSKINQIASNTQAISTETANRQNADNNLQSQIDAITASSDVTDIVGTYAQLQAYDTSTLPPNSIIKVLQDEHQNDETTYYRWVITGGVGAWVLIGEEGPYYTKSEADGRFVPQTRTINGKDLSNNISLDASDVGALPSSTVIPTVNNGTLDIQVNGTSVGTFTANQSGNTTANIVVPDSATWGNITGDIADQTDLQNALDDKQDTLVAGTDLEIVVGSGASNTVSGTNSIILSNASANSLSSVIVYGKCSQTGTPTTSNPIDIVCNNGAIKYNTGTSSFYTEGTVETVTDSLNNTATAEMLLGFGDYIDTQDLLGVGGTRKVGLMVLTGTEEFNTTTLTNCYALESALGDGNLTDRTVYCTHFQHASTLPSAGSRQGYALIGNRNTPSNTYTVGFGATTEFRTVALFKSWLATQYANGTPVIIAYPLATPTTFGSTAQTLNTKSGSNQLTITQSAISNLNIKATYTTDSTSTINFTNESGYALQSNVNSALALKQDVLTAGTGIDITNNVISNTQTSAEWGNITGDIEDQTDLQDALNGKQDILTAGTDLEIIAGSGAILPDTYEELEYIQSDGACYIDTGIISYGNDIIEQKFQKLGTDTATCSWFGSMQGTTLTRVSIGSYYRVSDRQFVFFGGFNYTQGVGLADTNEHIIKLYGGSVIELDGVATTYTPQSNTNPTVTSYLFARHGYDTVNTVYDNEGTRIFYHKQKRLGGTELLDLVPARRIADGELGFYNLVNNTFLTNSGSGTLTGGNVVSHSNNTVINFTNESGYITGIDSTDVTDALGYTPVNPSSLATVATTGSYNDLADKPYIPSGVVVDQTYDPTSQNAQSGVAINGAGFLTGITSSDVTTALGYTPYNSSNPNGYTSNVGTVTSVNNVQPVNGNVTITIPTVPTNVSAFTNDAGYITSSALSGYVPVSANSQTISATSGDFTINTYYSLIVNDTINDIEPIRYDSTSQQLQLFNSDLYPVVAYFEANIPNNNLILNVEGDFNINTIDSGADVYINSSKVLTASDVDQTYDSTSSNAQSGVAIANAGFLTGITSSDVTTALGYTPYNSSNPSGYITSSDLPTNHVTTDTDQNITGVKTFVGQKKIAFKQSSSSDKLGFTLYNNSGTEKGYLEYNPSNTVDSVPLMTLGNYATASAGLAHVGFRKYSNISGANGAYNLLAPLISDAKTPFSLTTTYTNFYLPLGFTDGNSTVKTAKSGLVDLSSILPTVNNSTITFTQGGVTKGTITLNQASNSTIALDAGGSGGIQNTATGTDSLTILGTPTTFDYAMNIGPYSSVTEDDSIAIGQGASVSGADSLGIGRDCNVAGDNSIQLGNGTLIDNDTFQVWNYPLLDYQYGEIFEARIPSTIARTSQIANMQTTGNLVTSISSSSTDSQYPSAKCVYDIIGDIETLLQAV